MYSTMAGGSSTVSTNDFLNIEQINQSVLNSTLKADWFSFSKQNYENFDYIVTFIKSVSSIEILGVLTVILVVLGLSILKWKCLGDRIFYRTKAKLANGYDWRNERQRQFDDDLLRKMKGQRAINSKVSVFSTNQPEHLRLTEAQCTELCIRYKLGGGWYYQYRVTYDFRDRLYRYGGAAGPPACSQNMIDHVEMTPPPSSFPYSPQFR
uniref:Uncharacterized protein n=1 Tax=Pestalotiopsis fici TaxID=393283 RepID=A0A1D8RE16_9PEZI|nr:hypothetical protein [Pestalotiopsis fici]AOW71158.1 hypothetical protein [Pestalotiopsis fici]